MCLSSMILSFLRYDDLLVVNLFFSPFLPTIISFEAVAKGVPRNPVIIGFDSTDVCMYEYLSTIYDYKCAIKRNDKLQKSNGRRSKSQDATNQAAGKTAYHVDQRGRTSCFDVGYATWTQLSTARVTSHYCLLVRMTALD